jgi:hypothetical protein
MFNENELLLIDEVAEKAGITRSELVRRSVDIVISAVRLMRVYGNPKFEVTRASNAMLSKMFDKKMVSKLESEAKKIKASIKPRTYRRTELRIQKMNKEHRQFRAHKPRGRPKAEKRARGRPKDVGVAESGLRNQ